MCNLSWTPHSNLEKDNSLKTTPVLAKDGLFVWPNDYYVCVRFPELKFMSMQETLHIIAVAFNELRGYWPKIYTKLGDL